MRTRGLLLTVVLTALCVLAVPARRVHADSFETDVKALAGAPHRLSGTSEGHKAADIIERRLREMGIEEVFVLDMSVMQTRPVRCELTVGDVTVKLLPLKPNVSIPPVTPTEGLTGPLIYAGVGRPDDFGAHDVEGSIVVLEYDSYDGWRRAFAMGAKAVLFIGSPDVTPIFPKHVAIPANLVRLYVPGDVLNTIDLRKDYPKATVVSHVSWERSTGRNVVAVIPGTNKESRVNELIVLSAPYDSFGQIPRLSPGARRAANVAALLETAESLAGEPLGRDVLIAFVDNEARYQQGTRELYHALTMSDGLDAQLRREHLQEKDYVQRTIPLLEVENPRTWDAPKSLQEATVRALTETCDAIRSDMNRERMRIRMGASDADEKALKAQHQKWNTVRRFFSKGENAAAQAFENEPLLYRELCARVVNGLNRRLAELDLAVRIDEQRKPLRRRLGNHTILLHMAYDLSDIGPTWGLVAGDYLPKEPALSDPSADGPGHYVRILGAFRAAANSLPDDSGLEMETVRDPSAGRRFVSGPFVAGGRAAGVYGVYNLAVMTGHDARPRDGHPADTVANLNSKNIRTQARAFTALLRAAEKERALSQPSVFGNRALRKVPRWNDEKYASSGDFVGLRVTGELLEQRPASEAVMAIWPGVPYGNRQPGYYRSGVTAPFSFDPYVIEPVNQNGNYELVGLDRSRFRYYDALAAVFQGPGIVAYITSQDTLVPRSGASARIQTFAATGYVVGPPLTGYGRSGLIRTRVLRARYDAEFREDESLSGYDDHFTYFYIYRYYNLKSEGVKVFHVQGPALLGMTSKNPYGDGYPVGKLLSPPPVDRWTARDLFRINETRLSALRKRGITDRSLEALHGRARRLLDRAESQDADGPTVVERQLRRGRSTQLSRRVHGPLRLVMNDLVQAIVILLLLAIPFAFVMERLLICATSIYARLAGFAGIFIITFALLYVMHPGFAIASTPIIIFLAFVIILLSSLVIFIVVRKFRTELKAIQGQSGRRHTVELSWLGTLIAAANMGISTMRRRPIRTILTAVTVVILTFTILCFASMSSHVGVRDVYEGTASDDAAAGMFMRRLDCKELSPDVLTILHGHEGAGGLIAGQWWLVGRDPTDTPFSVAEARTGESFLLDGIMGIKPEEIERNDALAAMLSGKNLAEKTTSLSAGRVYLPQIVKDQLGLKVGDEVLLAGRRVRLAGTFDANRLQLLNNLDGRSVLPVDFKDPSSVLQEGPRTEILVEADESLASRDFVRLSPNQVAIVSDEQVQRLGGMLHAINIYPGEEVDHLEQGHEIVEQVDTPVWVRGPEGVERLVFTRLTEISGGMTLIVPVALGGLIIFGTMLGSVTDRQKEIYSFSALGLAPTDVGFLFFAEAAVYAVVGGMVGQLLAQTLAVVASFLAEHRYIQPVSTNFSSANSLFAMGVVMGTVLLSAIYPAYCASKSANPGLKRRWKMPPPVGDLFNMTFPFTVSAYDITGVVSFLAEHFRQHDDAGLGVFAADQIGIERNEEGSLMLSAHLALAPFDLGVTEDFELTASPSEIPGVDEVSIRVERRSGAATDWKRTNRTFLQDLREQFLLWRTLSVEAIESYRMQTLQEIGTEGQPDVSGDATTSL